MVGCSSSVLLFFDWLARVCRGWKDEKGMSRVEKVRGTREGNEEIKRPCFVPSAPVSQREGRDCSPLAEPPTPLSSPYVAHET